MCHIEKTFKRKNVYYKKKLLIINFVIYSWNPSAKKLWRTSNYYQLHFYYNIFGILNSEILWNDLKFENAYPNISEET